MTGNLLTTKEFAARARVPESTVRWWRHSGTYGPPSARIGRRVVYREADVARWIEEQFTDAAGDRPGAA